MPRKAKPGKKFKLKTHKATSKRFRLTGSGVLALGSGVAGGGVQGRQRSRHRFRRRTGKHQLY